MYCSFTGAVWLDDVPYSAEWVLNEAHVRVRRVEVVAQLTLEAREILVTLFEVFHEFTVVFALILAKVATQFSSFLLLLWLRVPFAVLLFAVAVHGGSNS